MATPREHMLADLDWLFEQEGEAARDVVIDGATYRAIVEDLETMPADIEGAARRRQMLSLRLADMPMPPRAGYAMTVDGELWTVESASRSGILTRITLGQYD
jgi:hypothetical protein